MENNNISNNDWLVGVGGLIIGLALGFIGGYYYATMKVTVKPDSNKSQNTNVTANTNPYSNIQTNPYTKVKVNPFQ